MSSTSGADARRASARSFRRPGALVPSGAAHFKGRAVTLRPGRAVEWHTTGAREEVLVILAGSVQLELRLRPTRRTRMALRSGRCAFVPRHMRHRVVNRSRRVARYLYFTA